MILKNDDSDKTFNANFCYLDYFLYSGLGTHFSWDCSLSQTTEHVCHTE